MSKMGFCNAADAVGDASLFCNCSGAKLLKAGFVNQTLLANSRVYAQVCLLLLMRQNCSRQLAKNMDLGRWSASTFPLMCSGVEMVNVRLSVILCQKGQWKRVC